MALMKSGKQPLKGGIIVGINDHWMFGDGWHERATDGRFGLMHRPSGPEASFFLNLPGGDVRITALISGAVTLCGGKIRGKIYCGFQSPEKFILDSENWVIRRFDFKNAPPGRTPFTWIIENPFIPNDLLGNGDFRKMGINTAAIRVENIRG